MPLAKIRAPRRALLIALVALSVAACSWGAKDAKDGKPAKPAKTLEEKLADRGYKLGGDTDKILNWNIDGWSYVDDEHVVFNAGPSRDYLVTVEINCTGLRNAETIAFTSTVSAVTKFDKLIVRNTGFTDQCQIRELHELKRIKKSS